MKRTIISRKRFYDIRRALRMGNTAKEVCKTFNVVQSTISKISKAHNFKEYKEMGRVYGAGVKVLRLKHLFVLLVLIFVIFVINFILLHGTN